MFAKMFLRSPKIRGEVRSTSPLRILSAIAVFSLLLLPSLSFANLPMGTWAITGNIQDLRMSGEYIQRTNNLSFEGHYDNGRFLIDMTPIDTEDDIAESAGWDGHLFYLIQRYPKVHGKGLPRTESLGIIEPTVFSRYATHALIPVILAFAGTNALDYLQSGKDIFILGNLRRYPEEEDTFKVNLRSSGVDIEAICHGGEERNPTGGMVPIIGFKEGFTRWTYKSDLQMTDPSNGVISVQYKRFYPFGGKLYIERNVTGKILLSQDKHSVSMFRPKIIENDLLVNDYRFRAMLLPYSKGLADQCQMYELTHHVWDYDSNLISDHFEMLRNYLSTNGAGNLKYKDDPFKQAEPASSRPRRIIIFCVFATFSALLFGTIWFNSRKKTQK